MNHDYSLGDGPGIFDVPINKKQVTKGGNQMMEDQSANDGIGEMDTRARCVYDITNKKLTIESLVEDWTTDKEHTEVAKFLASHQPKSQYGCLKEVFEKAYMQAAEGKGKERHANGLPFDQQPLMSICRMVGVGGALYQAMKKTQESQTLLKVKGKEAAKAEILGAINYLAAAYLLYDEME